jgi:hypothetical protein
MKKDRAPKKEAMIAEKIQEELRQTSRIVVNCIHLLAERGEKLEKLDKKSQELAVRTKTLKQNSRIPYCCTIL